MSQLSGDMMDMRPINTRPPARPERYDATGVKAVLGPTNTGKTWLAIERMVAHSSGVIGLPLRLLAREVYQRVVDRVGVGAVSLITGEEKIKPPNARYSVCTVEAMPVDSGAAFVAIDEVQLAGDLERGHVFTDRILHMRGREETLLLGSATMRGVLERLMPGIAVQTRPRLSQLLYAGSKKITRLPRRSAIVAFSADEVYAIAELIRRQRGGAAVVLGALSPRTRNAQVELYQNGDVEFLVATDAVGMGLNLDVDHVAFAQDWKFDGFQYRQLSPSEYGQIAGRAGRHVRDGTFGVTGQVDPLSQELVEALEAHRFEPLKVLQWRSRQLDFSSCEALRQSLDAAPATPDLTRSLPSVDQRALGLLAADPGIAQMAKGARAVELLWEACKLPDYRRIAPAQHGDIIASIYRDLIGRGHVAEDYMAAQVQRADFTEGDIDALSRRIAEIRTWTYISHRPGWLADPSHWQEKTRAIEDRLSDALHERLTKRFVDRRTSVLMRRLRENAFMEAEIGGDGKVLVEGHHVGELQGFRFTPDAKSDGPDAKAVRAAAQKALSGEYDNRAERFANAPNGDFALGSDGLLRWLGAPVAVLSAGDSPLRPRIVLLADDQLAGAQRDKVQARAERYVTYQVSTVLKPLVDLEAGEGLEGTAKGIAYRLAENFGILQRREIADDVRSLDQDARAALRALGVRFGAYHIFLPLLVKPAPAQLITLLWGIRNDGRDRPGFGEVTQLLATGRTSAPLDAGFDPIFYTLSGYRVLGRRAVRVDILERLADLIRPALAWKPGVGKRPEGAFDGREFQVTAAMMSILGATPDDMDEILKGLGYRARSVEQAEVERLVAAQEAASAPAVAELPPEDAAIVEEAAIATPTEAADPVSPSEADEVQAESPLMQPAAAVTDEEAVETVPEDAPVPVDAVLSDNTPADTVEVATGEAIPDDAAPAATDDAADTSADAAPEERKLVQLWKPHRGEGRGGRRDDARANRGGQQQRRRPGGNQGAPAGAPGEARRNEREGQEGAQQRKPWQKTKRVEGRGKPRPDQDERKPATREERRPERQKPIDPDSPFAKLAALKDMLKK